MLWTPISFRGIKDVAQVQDRLSRSQNVPIDVSLAGISTREEAELAVQLLVPHVKRWRSFRMDILESKVTDVILNALERVEEAPLLESMSLSNGVGISGTPFHLFHGNAPSLRSLSLKNIPLKWDAPMFNGVETLYMASHMWRPDACFERCKLFAGAYSRA